MFGLGPELGKLQLKIEDSLARRQGLFLRREESIPELNQLLAMGSILDGRE